MQSKKIIIFGALFLLLHLSVPIYYSFAEENPAIDQETKERLMEQYGLEEPESPTSEQQQNILFGGDWGFSPSAGAVMLELAKLTHNPLVFISQQLVHSLRQ
ncbi:hypothetical protein [Paenibacillus sp. BJ-4]|uniref:hypothetical protein n=1 Tax=Paenibacillus sp. BJ-4 TaxID=2878097 RepID=UPI001CEFF454|nr:hypothetical protein [Paenibacillus sp. BJ-4]